MRRSQIDWLSFASESRIDCELTEKLKNIIRPALEALIRWVDNGVLQSDQIAPKHKIQGRYPTVRLPKPDRAPASGRVPVRPKPSSLASADPVEEFPEPLFAWTEDPQPFQQALNYHMRRFGETYWRLHRATIEQHEIFDIRTISSWASGTKTPRSADSFDVLKRMEKRYRLLRFILNPDSLIRHDQYTVTRSAAMLVPPNGGALSGICQTTLISFPLANGKRSSNGSGV